jgi:hypothetical protein
VAAPSRCQRVTRAVAAGFVPGSTSAVKRVTSGPCMGVISETSAGALFGEVRYRTVAQLTSRLAKPGGPIFGENHIEIRRCNAGR